MAKDLERPSQRTFELNCTAYEVKGTTFTPTPGGDGGLFSCSVGPLAEDTIAALDDAASRHSPVCLLFGESPLLLDLVTLERKDARRVRIVGHVLVPMPPNKASA